VGQSFTTSSLSPKTADPVRVRFAACRFAPPDNRPLTAWKAPSRPVDRPSLRALAAAALVALGGGCGNETEDQQGALVAVLDVRGTPDVSMPLHITVQDDDGREVEDGSLHNARQPLIFLLPAGSYRLTAMPGCSDTASVPKGSSATVVVSIDRKHCSVIRM
jgi:hypothetical protein